MKGTAAENLRARTRVLRASQRIVGAAMSMSARPMLGADA